MPQAKDSRDSRFSQVYNRPLGQDREPKNLSESTISAVINLHMRADGKIKATVSVRAVGGRLSAAAAFAHVEGRAPLRIVRASVCAILYTN